MNQKSRRTSPRSTGGRLRTSGQAPFGVAVPCPIRPRRTRWRLPAACALKATCAHAYWPNGLRKRAAMPLVKIQSDILRLLAAHRDPESYVAGSTPLNVNAPRFSGDIDVFHDREERVARAAQEDSAVLQAEGYDLQWLRREPAMYADVASKGDAATRLEWVVDSDYRFFPTQRDETFGYVLHPVDLATNKIMAAAGLTGTHSLVIASEAWRSRAA